MIDLSRIPEQHRDRLQRDMSAAWTIAFVRAGNTPANIAAGDKAAQTVLARYLEIADKADAEAEEAREGARRARALTGLAKFGIGTPDEAGREAAEAAGLAVWSRELAKLDGEALAALPPWPGPETEQDRARGHLDTLVRYLADKPGETLRTIAALVKLLPVAKRGRVFAHTRGFYEIVAAVPGARLSHNPPTQDYRKHIYGAEALVDGVEFEALYTVAAEPGQVTP